MSLENFIAKALDLPSDTIGYTVSRRLAALFPERTIVEGSDCTFDVHEYADAGLCEFVGEPGVHKQVSSDWNGSRRTFDRRIENAWLQVFWAGHLLDVLYLTWTDEGCRTRFYWVAAESPAVAEGFVTHVCDWCAVAHGEVLVYNYGYWHKDAKLHAAIRSATFDTLVLPEPLVTEIRRDVARFFGSRAVYDRYGVVWKRGLLLTGPPGNGKTHTVKALVNDSGVACLYVRSFRSRSDRTEINVHHVFERARRAAPCLVVLEDLDSLVDGKCRSYFLNELDGFAANTGVLVLATSNYPEKIDPALVNRPGRFDRRYEIGPPAAAERRASIDRWNEALQPEMRVDEGVVDATVEGTDGFSFAYVKELLVSATTEWAQASIGDGEEPSMAGIIETRLGVLREQIAALAADAGADERDDEEDES